MENQAKSSWEKDDRNQGDQAKNNEPEQQRPLDQLPEEDDKILPTEELPDKEQENPDNMEDNGFDEWSVTWP